jgi:2-dehydropantoate 2-reductase
MESGIHILGLGNLGKYVAFALRRKQQTVVSPVTLIFHRKGLLEDWERESRSIRYYTPDCLKTQPPVEKLRATGFRVEFLGTSSAANHGVENQTYVINGSKSPIRHLIVTTKTYATAAALAPIKDRLGKDSHILFLQNGIGMCDARPLILALYDLTSIQVLPMRSLGSFSRIQKAARRTGPAFAARVFTAYLRSPLSMPVMDP